MTWIRLFKVYLPDGRVAPLKRELTTKQKYTWKEEVRKEEKQLQSTITNVEQNSQYVTGRFDYDYIKRSPTRDHPEGIKRLYYGDGSFVLSSEGLLLFFGGERGSKCFASHLRHTTEVFLKPLPLSGEFLKKLRTHSSVYGVKKISYTGLTEDFIEEYTIKGENIEESTTYRHLQDVASEIRKLTIEISIPQTVVTMSFFETGSMCLYGYDSEIARQYALSAVEQLSPILPKVEPPLDSFTAPPITEMAQKAVKET